MLDFGLRFYKEHFRICQGEFHELHAFATLRYAQAYLVRCQFGEIFFDLQTIFFGNRVADGDFVRNQFFAFVPFEKRFAKNFGFVLFLVTFELIMSTARNNAFAVFKDDGGGEVSVAAHSDHIEL